MIRKGLFLLLLALPLTVLLESCIGCGPFDEQRYQVHQIGLKVGLRNYEAYVDSLSYPAEQVLFLVNVTDFTFLAMQGAGLFPSALACSPPEPQSAQRLTGLSIVSPDTLILGQQLADTLVLLPGTELRSYFELASLYDGTQSAHQWSDIAEKKPRLDGVYAVVRFWMSRPLWQPIRHLQLRMDLDDGRRLVTNEVSVQLY